MSGSTNTTSGMRPDRHALESFVVRTWEIIRKSRWVKHLRPLLHSAFAGNFAAVRSRILLLALLVTVPVAEAQRPIDVGLLRLTIHKTRTAQVFHIVDQLADWDARTHRAYVRWAADSLALDSTDQALLKRHAVLRRARGWNHGFERVFYSDTFAVKTPLPASEMKEEVLILEHFSKRLAPMLDASAERVHALALRLPLVRDSLAGAMAAVIRLSGVTKRIDVPVYLVPNPMSGTRGGRFVANSVILEVPVAPDPLIALEHELFHVLLAPSGKRVRAAAKAAGEDFDVFGEALAYAFSPGLTGSTDVLQRQSDASLAGSPTRHVLRVALLLRPLLRDALDSKESLPTLLNHAGALLRGSALF